jgi:hypothetical protein
LTIEGDLHLTRLDIPISDGCEPSRGGALEQPE